LPQISPRAPNEERKTKPNKNKIQEKHRLNRHKGGDQTAMDLEIIVIITNTLVVLATFIATLYRIKIEREQIRTVKQDVKAKECLESLRKYIKEERNLLAAMNKEELKEFLDYLEKLGKC
jgi:hypothetical protein